MGKQPFLSQFYFMRLIISLLILATVSALYAGGSSPVKKQSPKETLPSYAFHYNKGTSLLTNLDFTRAIPLLKKSISQKGNFAQAHNNLAYCYRKTNQFDLAMKHYDKAIQINPRLAEAYMYRGVLHVQQNNIDKARSDLATLQSLDNYLATELSFVIQNKVEKTPEKFFGVTKKVRK
jgi:tetratricopeptide (TPR) repeat protein